MPTSSMEDRLAAVSLTPAAQEAKPDNTPGKSANVPPSSTKEAKSRAGSISISNGASKSAQSDAKVSGKEAKLKAKAEKQARREKEKQERQFVAPGSTGDRQQNSHPPTQPAKSPTGQAPAASRPQHRRKSSAGAHGHKALAIRKADPTTSSKSEEPKKGDKRVPLFEHLYGQQHRQTIAGASKDIHPAILALGLHLSSYKILGSNARCVATLLALQQVISSYTTPVGNSLPRHLTTHLASQIEYLVSCRPLSVSQGNAIRWLKVKISAVDVSTPEAHAKLDLCTGIDDFIRERIVVADDVIAAHTHERIHNGDTILTYARSTIVEKSLLKSYELGKKFKIIVVDSEPLFEGRTLARNLAQAGIEVQYTLIDNLSHIVRQATKALFGAQAMMANGSLYSRNGTAMVALAAKTSHIPVMVCCESVKLSERAALDSIALNEVAPEDELVPFKAADGIEEHPLTKWRDIPGLKLLNLVYDVTPPSLIDLVLTEHGNMPATSVMAVGRPSANG